MRSLTAFGRVLLAATVLAALSASPSFSQEQSGSLPSVSPMYRGVLVLSVEPGSPADSAGLARGDIILSIGGREVNQTGELTQAVLAQRVGQRVSVRFLHGDVDRTVTVVLESRSGLPFLGVVLEPTVPGPVAAGNAPEIAAVSRMGAGSAPGGRSLSESVRAPGALTRPRSGPLARARS